MIRYALRCRGGHEFESWFQSAAAFERLSSAGQLACVTCGTKSVTKAPMAPAIPRETTVPPAAPAPSATADQGAPGPVDDRLAALRARIERESDYVGARFVAEVRDMHEGRIPNRAVHGEARIDEARRLIEDGIEVVPLPMVPRRKLS